MSAGAAVSGSRQSQLFVMPILPPWAAWNVVRYRSTAAPCAQSTLCIATYAHFGPLPVSMPEYAGSAGAFPQPPPSHVNVHASLNVSQCFTRSP